MINIIREKIFESIKAQGLKPPAKSKINVEYPKLQKFGDYSSNVALSLAKKYKKKPMLLAKKIAQNISMDALFKSVSAEKPGFVNFQISRMHLMKFLPKIVEQEDKFGSDMEKGKGKKILLEFVSANPTGPLNIVNARAASVGDSLANILSFLGYKVEKEFLINDAGNQVDLLIKSIEFELNILGHREIEEFEGRYLGDYVQKLAKKFLSEETILVFQVPYKERLQKLREFALNEIISNQRFTLKLFNVCFDNWISEQELRDRGCIEDALTYLAETENTYDKDGAVWFCSSKFGDEKDRVIMKTDGGITYLVPDLAYHITKYKRGYHKIIDIFGPDHHGYTPRLKAGIAALGFNPKLLSFILLQQVSLIYENEKVKMSKRRGKIITLQQLIDEVGTDVARFFFLMRKLNTPLDFDIHLAKEKSNENPVYYVQYAHARICSILQNANKKRLRLRSFRPRYLNRLRFEEELDIIRHLYKFPELILHIGKNYDLNLMTKYLTDLAALFHSYYQKVRIISPKTKELSLARLFLCKTIKITIHNGLNLLGVSAPKKM